MIDSHCHLAQKDYDSDRDKVIEDCKKELKAVITSCAHPKDFNKTMEIVDKYKGFVFCTVGIHPEYIKELTEQQISEHIELIKQNKEKIIGIGEIGLDYKHIEEPEWREKQKTLFIRMINLAKELDKPLVIHSREALEETLEILKKEKAKKVLLHMWGGHNLMEKVESLGYYVSMNAIIMRSKSYRKVVKKQPLEKLMLETDAPWLAVKKADNSYELDAKARNIPLTIKLTAQKIAELKNMDFNDIWTQCAHNAISFFMLTI